MVNKNKELRVIKTDTPHTMDGAQLMICSHIDSSSISQFVGRLGIAEAAAVVTQITCPTCRGLMDDLAEGKEVESPTVAIHSWSAEALDDFEGDEGPVIKLSKPIHLDDEAIAAVVSISQPLYVH